MNKFSVIIPTIWKGLHLNELLEATYKSDYIDEVILINNDINNTKEYPKNNKITLLEPKQNIFVNPAWNVGVSIAKNDKIIIAQDDLIFDVDTLCHFIDMAEKQNYPLKSLGFIGMSYGNFFLEKNAEEIELEDCHHTPAWATIMIFHRDNWSPIPHQLKIHYGDDFIKRGMGKPIFQIRGLCVKTEMSTSAGSNDSIIKQVLINDEYEWKKLLNR